MRKTIIVLLSVFLVMSLFGCEDTGAGAGTGDGGEATVEESLLVPEFYNPSFGSRAIEFPTLSTEDNINEVLYSYFAPSLVRFSEDANHTSGDTVTSTFMGVPVTIVSTPV